MRLQTPRLGRESSCTWSAKYACHSEASEGKPKLRARSTHPPKRHASSLIRQPVLPSAAIMARLIVALACAAGVSAFLAPSAPVSTPKTVVFGKGGELRDRKRQRPHVICTVAAAAAIAASKASAQQFTCKKTAGKRRNSRCAETSEKKNLNRVPRAATRRREAKGRLFAAASRAPRRRAARKQTGVRRAETRAESFTAKISPARTSRRAETRGQK